MSSKFNQVLFNLFRLDQDKASNKAIHQTISSATEIKGTNMLILMMAIFIASIGLNTKYCRYHWSHVNFTVNGMYYGNWLWNSN